MKIAMALVGVCAIYGLATLPANAAGPRADNTAQNKGATQKNSVEAEKQKSDKDQVTVLAEIRSSIVAEPGLSMDAKNVKILYSKGIVTLRGPVDSIDEKTTVERLAKQCDAVGTVKNLTTIANKPH